MQCTGKQLGKRPYHVAFVGKLVPQFATGAVLQHEVQAVVVLKRGVEVHYTGVLQFLESPLFHVDFVVNIWMLKHI